MSTARKRECVAVSANISPSPGGDASQAAHASGAELELLIPPELFEHDDNSETAISLAISTRDPRFDALYTALDRQDRRMFVRKLRQHPTDCNCCMPGTGVSLLHYCMQFMNIDFATIVVFYGADINAADALGTTPLMEAVMVNYLGGVEFLLHVNTVRVRTNRDALRIDATNGQRNGDLTALHFAVLGGHVEIAKALLRAGANPAKKTGNNDTPLDIARYCSCVMADPELIAMLTPHS